MERLVLSDAAWERMAPLIIGRPDQKGSTGRDNRMFVEGVLWIVRTGSPWRDLPEAFGDWNSVFRRFSRWSMKGVWWRNRRSEGRCTASRRIDRGITRRGRHGRYGLRRRSPAPSHRRQGSDRRHPQQP